MADNKTIWQRLTQTFNGSKVNQPAPDSFSDRDLITSNSKVEFEKDKLQAQQSFYLHKQYVDIVKDDKMKNVGYESMRLMEYADYEAMESYPIIGSALNLFAGESTVVGQNGRMLSIYSKDKRVKKELEKLFYDVIGIDTVLYFWARNLCKYGNNYVFLMLDENDGVIGTKQLPVVEMDRIEEEKDNKIITYFKNRLRSDRQYTIWQIAHFRLLGNDRMMPYGMSILNKVRRTWKMLNLSEDAMMIYRITRAAERRIIKVNVGNMPPEDIPQYVQAQANYWKKAPLINPSTGDINWKYNVATNDSDIFIPVTSDNAGNQVDTLPGASNLSDIVDISYLRDNLFSGLEVPKSFLAFSSEGGGRGDGKSLAQLDVIFARKVNRIQQALIQELNKIAIIHLKLLGGDFEKNLGEFTLSLANPSTQGEILRITALSDRMDLYDKAVRASDTGIKPMSETKAKREILMMTDDEILEDLQDQMIETKIGDEIRMGGQTIKSSGLFNKLTKFVNAGVIGKDALTGGSGEAPPPTGGEPSGEMSTDAGTEPESTEPAPLAENNKRNGKLLSESLYTMVESLENDLKNEKFKEENDVSKTLMDELDEKLKDEE